MGIFGNKTPDADLPLIDDETGDSFAIAAQDGSAIYYRRTLKALGFDKIKRGGGSPRFEVTVRVGRMGTVKFSHAGQRLAIAEVAEVPAVEMAMIEHEVREFRATAYMYKSASTGGYGLRVFL